MLLIAHMFIRYVTFINIFVLLYNIVKIMSLGSICIFFFHFRVYTQAYYYLLHVEYDDIVMLLFFIVFVVCLFVRFSFFLASLENPNHFDYINIEFVTLI